jgi:MFS family permease
MTLAALTGRRSVVVSTLGITQTLAWGSTYYLTAVFADPVSIALGLPRVWFFGIFSAALLLSGLMGPLAGRMIDRYGGRDVLAATNLVFAAGLVLMSFASNAAGLALAWAVLGLATGCGFPHRADPARGAKPRARVCRACFRAPADQVNSANQILMPVPIRRVGAVP